MRYGVPRSARADVSSDDTHGAGAPATAEGGVVVSPEGEETAAPAGGAAVSTGVATGGAGAPGNGRGTACDDQGADEDAGQSPSMHGRLLYRAKSICYVAFIAVAPSLTVPQASGHHASYGAGAPSERIVRAV